MAECHSARRFLCTHFHPNTDPHTINMPLTKAQKQAQAILETALNLAAESSWESVRLHHISEHLGIPLDQIRQHYREKEDLIDAWFDRADQAMLKVSEGTGFSELSRQQRLYATLMAWLDALSEHRITTRQMIQGKLEPGHIHYQVGGLLRISRTVQWWREAAGIQSTLPLRAFEEAALTGLYLVTFSHWLMDQSQNAQTTRDFLKSRLERAERISEQCSCPTSSRASTSKPNAPIQT